MEPKIGTNEANCRQCFNCSQTFKTNKGLMLHKKSEHKSKAACKYNKEGRCKYSDKDCGFSHNTKEHTKEENNDVYTCYICKTPFKRYNMFES